MCLNRNIGNPRYRLVHLFTVMDHPWQNSEFIASCRARIRGHFADVHESMVSPDICGQLGVMVGR